MRRARIAFALALHMTLSAACSSRDEGAGDSLAATHRRELASATDAVRASAAIRKASARSCQDMVQALAVLDHRAPDTVPLNATTYRGLVVDALDAARPTCPASAARDALRAAPNPAQRLALAIASETPGDALGIVSRAPRSAALLRERANLLFALDRHQEGRAALIESLSLEDDPEVRARAARLAIAANDPRLALELCGKRDTPELRGERAAALALLASYEGAAREVARAPVHLRRDIASRAVAVVAQPIHLAVADAPPELLVAVAERLDPASAVSLLARAAQETSQDADIYALLAERSEAAGQPLQAVSAWDRAAALAPGLERPVLAPIRILAESGRAKDARRRASSIRAKARSSRNADQLRLASLAFKYANDPAEAVELARAATRAREGDGRLVAELAARLAEAERKDEAAAELAALLVCGARGRPWHRHELVARLTALVGADAVQGHVAKVGCTPVMPADLKAALERVTAN